LTLERLASCKLRAAASLDLFTECVHKWSKRCDPILPFQPCIGLNLLISATPIIPVAPKFTAAIARYSLR